MPDRYFEDLTTGATYESDGRTVTRTEIIDFADRFDPQPFHVDEAAAAETMFGDLIASGIHTLGICQRLATDAFYADTAFVFGRGVDELRFPQPTRPGDTLSARVTIGEKFIPEGRTETGEVDVEVEGFNQRDEKIAGWTALAVVERRKTG